MREAREVSEVREVERGGGGGRAGLVKSKAKRVCGGGGAL